MSRHLKEMDIKGALTRTDNSAINVTIAPSRLRVSSFYSIQRLRHYKLSQDSPYSIGIIVQFDFLYTTVLSEGAIAKSYFYDFATSNIHHSHLGFRTSP